MMLDHGFGQKGNTWTDALAIEYGKLVFQHKNDMRYPQQA